MANTTLNTRIILCNDTTVNWGTSEKVLLKGELGIEITGGAPKVKVGNGTDAFKALPYITMTPPEIEAAIQKAIQAANHSHANKSILDGIQVALTNALKANYDAAFTHSKAPHAPAGAQANIIESVKVNGAPLPISDKAVNVSVPTKVSQLTNDSGFVSTDTKYNLTTAKSLANGNVKIDLVGTDGKNSAVNIKGTGIASVTTDETGSIVVNATQKEYVHPVSGVNPGTYKSVTVDSKGHVTAGTNPTTLAGYGITDAIQKGTKFGDTDITGMNASKLTGTIDIARLPHGALERCKVVADDAARFKLTKADVQTGDTVKVTGDGTKSKMYFVVDDNKLNTEEGYEEYTAGSATSVPWSGVTDKPSTFTPSAHNQDISTINGLQQALDGKATNEDMTGATGEANGTHGLVPAPIAGAQGKYLRGDGTWQTPPNTTYGNATGSTAGLMSPADKTKLDNIAQNANNYVHPTTPGNKHIPTGGQAGQFLKWSADGTAVWAADNNTTYGIANASTAGLVKSATGANKVTVDGTGIMSIATVSTDTIVNGGNTLILNGGGAA